jgi:hypothetical protein
MGGLDFDELNVEMQVGDRNTTLSVSADKVPSFIYHLSSRRRWPTDPGALGVAFALVGRRVRPVLTGGYEAMHSMTTGRVAEPQHLRRSRELDVPRRHRDSTMLLVYPRRPSLAPVQPAVARALLGDHYAGGSRLSRCVLLNGM